MRNIITLYMTTLFCFVNSARILGVFPFPTYSHFQIGDIYLKALAKKGHEVTVITAFPQERPFKNLRHVVLDVSNEQKVLRKNLVKISNNTMLENIVWMDTLTFEWTKITLEHKSLKKFLQSDLHFDLAILHQFGNDAFKGFCYHFNAPCITVSPMPTPYWINTPTGNSFMPSYVPEHITGFTSKMNFMQRLQNTFVSILTYVYFKTYTYPKQNELLQKHFPGAPHLDDLYYNISLMLINSHFGITYPHPHMPNMIEIGGYYIDVPKKLPVDLQQYLDSAKDGVIVFSMGSSLQMDHLPKEKLDGIIKALSKVKQKVLWKWKDVTLPNQSSNLKITKWLPQNDVLAHPNVKLVITHGGLLSSMENIYHGVPFIGIPIFSDQERNMAAAEAFGYGIKIDFDDLCEETLTKTIHEILTNVKYTENAKKRSKIMKDLPMKPLDTAVYWTEYVLRHRGALHLKSAAVNLYWYQYFLLDVIVFTGVILFFIVYLFIKLLRVAFCKKIESSTKEKKNN